MARRRVFRTRAKCLGISTDLGPIANKPSIVGQTVTLERSTSNPEISVCLDGTVVGQLDSVIGNQVALAIDRGQSFIAVIENAFPVFNDKFKRTGAQLDIKVEYSLDKGQPAIDAPKSWRAVESSPESSHAARSFFTTIAGVTFEGRQRVVGRCSEGERLLLLRDPNNPFDKGAIKVMRSNGDQLGFIPAHVSRGGDSSGLAIQMDRGSEYHCRIKNITGGGPGQSMGANIEITEGEEFDDVPAPAAPGARTHSTTVQPAVLWILAVIIGYILWAVFK
jgi:hypothetical protein